MGEIISWVAVDKSGEISLDSDLPRLHNGWERCLDLQSGVMYLKQMHAQPDALRNTDSFGSRTKRQKVQFGDNEGEGDPTLQLTLSTYSSADNNKLDPNQQSLMGGANKQGGSKRKSLSAEKWIRALQRDDAAPASSNGSCASQNTCSSASSSPPSEFKQGGPKGHWVGSRVKQANPEKSLISAAGCPHCFMYVLPSKNNPRCPRCKSSILVDLSPLTIH